MLLNGLKRRALMMIAAAGAAFACATSSAPGINVSGNITTDSTWTAANNPYVVNGNLTVDPGVTLTIDAGVEVQIYPGVFLKADRATIIADALDATHITFTKEPAQTGAGGI